MKCNVQNLKLDINFAWCIIILLPLEGSINAYCRFKEIISVHTDSGY